MRFTAPEGDATVSVVDLPDAKDAQDAVAQAWKRVQPDFKRTLLLTTPRSARNGWVDQAVFDYETSPNEKLTIQAIARRASTVGGWVVLLMQASEATLEKRGAPIGRFFGSLRPKGYERESFAGRTARPLTPERVEQLKAFVADGMNQLQVPGVGLSFIDGGKLVWAGGLGVRELGKPAPVDADTLFMAASNTKGHDHGPAGQGGGRGQAALGPASRPGLPRLQAGRCRGHAQRADQAPGLRLHRHAAARPGMVVRRRRRAGQEHLSTSSA